MNRKVFILIIFIVCGAVFSQHTPKEIAKLNIDQQKIKASGIKSILEIIYDGYYPKKLTERKRQICYYDENGMIIEKTSPVERLSGGYYRYKYFYDEKDKLVKDELAKRNPYDGGIENIWVNYAYDDKGRLIEASTHYDKIRKDYRIERFKYDEFSNLIEEYSNEEGEGEFLKIYKYDEKNNLVIREQYERKNSIDSLVDVWKYENKYDTLGRISQVTKNYNSDGLYSKHLYEYDSYDKLTKQISTSPWTSGQGKIFFEYDEKGNLIKIKSASEFEDFTRFQYDQNGNMKQEQTIDFSGNVIRQTDYIFEYYNK